MAFDGIVMAALGKELRDSLCGGVISKIAMPEKDELLITIRNNGNNYRLLVSAGASLPLIYLTEDNKNSPLTAPAFCMLLRKYIGTGKIADIRQPGLERIMIMDIEHRNDLGDLCIKKIIFEMMGKYSNIIFASADNVIIDSIKRVPSTISSVREVLPGRKYIFPEELKKRDLLIETKDDFAKVLMNSDESLMRSLFINYAGISPLIAHEICCRAGIDPDIQSGQCSQDDISKLYGVIVEILDIIKRKDFTPSIIKRKDEPIEFAPFHLVMYDAADYVQVTHDSMSKLLSDYYSAKDEKTRIRQRSADIRKIVTNALERAVKKYDIQMKQLKDCSERDKYKVYGDLINTYGYSLKGGEKSFTCQNFYDNNNEISIPLDEHKTASENAKRYFDKYSKLRRTQEALEDEIVNTEKNIEHLQSILQSIENSRTEGDLAQIRNELADYGYVKSHYGQGKDKKTGSEGSKGQNAKNQPKSQPLHFISSEGYDIYVGKNNYQNEEVTFKIASGNDWWFHAKGAAGSHVIIKTNGEADIPDKVFEEAAALAAFYSQNGANDKVEVDYTLKKNLKRVTGGAPGFVIYHTNYSMTVRPKEQI